MAKASPTPAAAPLAGSGVPFASTAVATGDIAGSTALTVQLWLKPDVTAASRFAVSVSTPGSPEFGRYLSPAAYTARFGATAATAATVESWLRSQGFTGIRTDSQRTYVRATALTSKINAAFHITMTNYRATAAASAGRYPLRANNRPVTLPVRVASAILGVTGLDNAALAIPLARPSVPGGRPAHATASIKAPCSGYYGEQQVTGAPEQFGTTTFPTALCGYSATQLRAAYGMGTASVPTGRGQTIALVELGLAPSMLLTLTDYTARNRLPAPSASRYSELSLGQGSACGDPFNGEEQLDVEASYAMAPAANQLVVGGDSCNDGDYGAQGLFDADIAVLDGSGGHPLASIASNSWGGSEAAQPALLFRIEHAYLVRSAAEGVGMYFSSADSSGVAAPADDPWAISVGGTSLGIDQAGNRLFETGWSTGISLDQKSAWVFQGEQGAAGGGPSLLWPQPTYQKGVVPKAMATVAGNRGGPVRSVPDISADADPYTGILMGQLDGSKYVSLAIGGTSLAAPLVAGIVAAAQQGQPKPFGFDDPALYKLAGSSAFNDTLPLTSTSPAAYRGVFCPAKLCGATALTTFDDQSPTMSGYTGQVTAKGYDNMTGLGTPDGPAFIAGLRTVSS